MALTMLFRVAAVACAGGEHWLPVERSAAPGGRNDQPHDQANEQPNEQLM
jgi:hypothetical protein